MGLCFHTAPWICCLASVIRLKAVSAVYRTIAARFERYLGLHAASCTSHIMHFPLLEPATIGTATAVLLFARRTALGTTAWLVGKPFLSEEILLRCCEDEVGAAIPAV